MSFPKSRDKSWEINPVLLRNFAPDNQTMIVTTDISTDLKLIADKVKAGQRITDEEGLLLFKKASLGFVGSLANEIRIRKNGDKVYFNRNFHIEPTNVCVFSCNFCSYSKLYAKREEGWELSIDQMLHMVKNTMANQLPKCILSAAFILKWIYNSSPIY